MPKRPRSHILEEESRNYFRSIIPSEWLFRDESPDYGIDGSIEIFDTNDESTALRFFVQLKATDSKNVKIQRTMRFRRSTGAYWHKQKYPTLLVQYCSVEKKTYWAWHFDRRITSKGEAKTASLRFEDTDIWSADVPSKIQAQLVAITRFKDQPTTFPIPVRLLTTESDGEIQIDEILRDEFGKLTSLVAYGDQRPEGSPIDLTYRDGFLCVDFAGITSFTFPVENMSPKQLADDILVAIALGFSTLRKCHLVGKLLSHSYAQSTLIVNSLFSVWLAQDLAQQKEFLLLRKIASHLTSQGDSYAGASTYVFMPTLHPNLLPDEERIRQQHFLIDHLKEVKRTFPASYGIAAYNTAEFLLATNRLRLAFHHFRIAIKANQYYAKSAYVFSQASGILFRLKHYYPAAVGYIQTMRIEKTRKAETMALLADAQLHRGKIGSAVFWLQNAVDKETLQRDQRIDLFKIQLIAAKKIIKILGTSRTSINTRESAKHLELAEQTPLRDAIPLAMKSVYLNPTSTQAWSLLRSLSFEDNDPRLAQDYALIAAALSDGNASYWMDLVVSCIFTPSDVSGYILISAFLSMPEFLADEAYDRAKRATSPKQKQFFRELGEHLSQLPHRKPPRVIRIRDIESGEPPEVFHLD